MNEKESWKGIGEEIRKNVMEALDSGDFSNLGTAVFDTVADTVRTVSERVGETVSVNQTRIMSDVTKSRQRARQQAERQKQQKAAPVSRPARAPFNEIGSVAHVLWKVFGGISTGLTGIFTLGCLLLTMYSSAMAPFLVLSLCLLGGSIAMISRGVTKKKRLDKAEYILKLAGNNHYINVSDLAKYTGDSKKKLLADIMFFLREGYYPEGHLDKKRTCLMLDNKIFAEYLELEKQRQLQEKEEREIAGKEQIIPQNTASTKTELEQLIAEGHIYIDQLRTLNDHIHGEEISAKLFRLESLLTQIYARLEEHPEQLPQLKKFLEYYLPTTLKLVSAYEDFDAMSEQGADILEAKAEIEKTLDTINDAFAELLNRLYRDTAFDVTTDAQVLQTMLAQEGLSGKNDFQKKTQ